MTFGSDLDFTLWGYPNHHRALITLTRLAAREKTDMPAGAQFTVDCYFARAFRIAPDDGVARMIYARYLGNQKRLPQAMSNLKLVIDQAGDNPLTHLNAGLVYLELEAYEEASAQARRVAELGFPHDRLTRELQRRGKWRGPLPRGSGPIDAASTVAPGGTSPSVPDTSASGAGR